MSADHVFWRVEFASSLGVWHSNAEQRAARVLMRVLLTTGRRVRGAGRRRVESRSGLEPRSFSQTN